jgi:endonuclease I
MVSGVSFEPCDAAKGEIARAVMYGTVMYSYTMTNEIKSIELALKWHLQHPNTERDIRRNNVVYGNQGNRNPFVDHPEYACKIWGNTNSATKSLCGGN